MASESDDDFFGGDDSSGADDCEQALWGARADVRKAIAAAATSAYREASAEASDDAMQQAFEEGFDQVRPGEFARGWVVGSLRAAALLLRGRFVPSSGAPSTASEAAEALAVAEDADALALVAVAVGGREARADAAAVAALNAVVRAHDRSSGEGDEAAGDDEAAKGRVWGIGRRAGALLGPGVEPSAEAGAKAGETRGASLSRLEAAASSVLVRAAQLLGGKGPLEEGPVAAAVRALQAASEPQASA